MATQDYRYYPDSSIEPLSPQPHYQPDNPQPGENEAWSHTLGKDGPAEDAQFCVLSPISDWQTTAYDSASTMYQNQLPSLHDYPAKAPVGQAHVQNTASVQCQPQLGHKQYGWATEIGSAVFSILCVVAIVVVLSRLDGQLLSSWTLAISPNAVIAVLSTASKAAMILPVAESISQLKWLHLERKDSSLHYLQIFDDASRGPWGALKLVWFARRASVTTYLGCFVTIMAIAFDPFTQQIFNYVQLPTPVPNILSSVTRSQVFDNQGQGVSGTSNIIGPTRDGPLQAAVVSGIYDLVSPPPFVCPGSNCTYPSFTSLGVCSQCANVTGRTVKSCVSNPDALVAQLCNYTTPGGFQLMAYEIQDAHSGIIHTNINTTVELSDSSTGTPVILSMAMIQFSSDVNGFSTNDTGWQNTLTAYECDYHLCAQAYSNWTYANSTTAGDRQMSPLNVNGAGPIVLYSALNADFPGNKTFSINYLDFDTMQQALQDVLDSNSPANQGMQFLNALYNNPTGRARTIVSQLR